jgi:hypothetical protein
MVHVRAYPVCVCVCVFVIVGAIYIYIYGGFDMYIYIHTHIYTHRRAGNTLDTLLPENTRHVNACRPLMKPSVARLFSLVRGTPV